jgi:hypothetical protein
LTPNLQRCYSTPKATKGASRSAERIISTFATHHIYLFVAEFLSRCQATSETAIDYKAREKDHENKIN